MPDNNLQNNRQQKSWLVKIASPIAVQAFESSGNNNYDDSIVNINLQPEDGYLNWLQSELAAAKKSLAIAETAKTNFLSNMEHDIRTPFAGILAIAGLLQQQEADAQKQRLLQLITNAANEILSYIDHILAFIRDTKDNIVLLARKFNVRHLLNKILNIYLPIAESKGLKLNLTVQENVPNIVIGDDTKLQKILINLISNAIKFTEQGHITIKVKARKLANNHLLEGEDYTNLSSLNKYLALEFSIEDTGFGMNEETTQAIYQTFMRLTPANKGKFKGLGLGLSLTKQLIEQMNGEIAATSTLAKGSKFVVTIPLQLPLIENED